MYLFGDLLNPFNKAIKIDKFLFVSRYSYNGVKVSIKINVMSNKALIDRSEERDMTVSKTP